MCFYLFKKKKKKRNLPVVEEKWRKINFGEKNLLTFFRPFLFLSHFWLLEWLCPDRLHGTVTLESTRHARWPGRDGGGAHASPCPSPLWVNFGGWCCTLESRFGCGPLCVLPDREELSEWKGSMHRGQYPHDEVGGTVRDHGAPGREMSSCYEWINLIRSFLILKILHNLMGVLGLKSKILIVALGISHHLTAYFFCVMFYLTFYWLWRKEGKHIHVLFLFLMYSLVGLVCVVIGVQTRSLGGSQWCSNQLNYPARVPPSSAMYETPLLYVIAEATLAFGSSSDVTVFPPVGFCTVYLPCEMAFFSSLHPCNSMSVSYPSNLVSASSFAASSTLDLPFLQIHHPSYSSSIVSSSLDRRPVEGSRQACLTHPRRHPASPLGRQTADSGETAVKCIHVSKLLKIILWANWVMLPETWEPNRLFLLCLSHIQLGNEEVWRAGTINGDSGWGISAREPGQDSHCEIGTFSREVTLCWASSVPR